MRWSGALRVPEAVVIASATEQRCHHAAAEPRRLGNGSTATRRDLWMKGKTGACPDGVVTIYVEGGGDDRRVSGWSARPGVLRVQGTDARIISCGSRCSLRGLTAEDRGEWLTGAHHSSC